MTLNLITDLNVVARAFERWKGVLQEASIDHEDCHEIVGEGVLFRTLVGDGRTEFWVGQSEHAAVQINLPSDPRTENGLAGMAADEEGNLFLLRQGVLHKNGASQRIESKAFEDTTGLLPVPVMLLGEATSRPWFLVTALDGVDDSAIRRSTAEFVRHCWAARGQIVDRPEDGDAQANDVDVPGKSNISLPSGRVWVTSFWGFNPEGDGYLGFTREGDRTWFLRQWRPGDLVMIYGTMGKDAEEADRGRIMGFLEIEPRTIRDMDRMSPEGRQWKIENRLTERWSYAVPAVRAWRAVDLPEVRSLAPNTLGPGANWQLISSRGTLLQAEEASAALAIKVRPVDVYGQPPLPEDEKDKVYVPSRGFPMNFGRRVSETRDGTHFLYALQLDGDVGAIMGQPAHSVRGKTIVKVGLAQDPDKRCAQHNACLPPAAKMRWKLMLRSRPLSDGQSALLAETNLKERLSHVYKSLGGEFFLCDARTLAAEFANAKGSVG